MTDIIEQLQNEFDIKKSTTTTKRISISFSKTQYPQECKILEDLRNQGIDLQKLFLAFIRKFLLKQQSD